MFPIFLNRIICDLKFNFFYSINNSDRPSGGGQAQVFSGALFILGELEHGLQLAHLEDFQHVALHVAEDQAPATGLDRSAQRDETTERGRAGKVHAVEVDDQVLKPCF